MSLEAWQAWQQSWRLWCTIPKICCGLTSHTTSWPQSMMIYSTSLSWRLFIYMGIISRIWSKQKSCKVLKTFSRLLFMAMQSSRLKAIACMCSESCMQTTTRILGDLTKYLLRTANTTTFLSGRRDYIPRTSTNSGNLSLPMPSFLLSRKSKRTIRNKLQHDDHSKT